MKKLISVTTFTTPQDLQINDVAIEINFVEHWEDGVRIVASAGSEPSDESAFFNALTLDPERERHGNMSSISQDRLVDGWRLEWIASDLPPESAVLLGGGVLPTPASRWDPVTYRNCLLPMRRHSLWRVGRSRRL